MTTEDLAITIPSEVTRALKIPERELDARLRLELLRSFYGMIHVPEAVWDELVKQGRGKPGSDEIANAPWIEMDNLRDNAHFWISTPLYEKLLHVAQEH